MSDKEHVIRVPKMHRFSLYMPLKVVRRVEMVAMQTTLDTGRLTRRSHIINEAVNEYLMRREACPIQV